jgi:hypothetical protein
MCSMCSLHLCVKLFVDKCIHLSLSSHSVPLHNVCTFMLGPACICYYSFVMYFELGGVMPPGGK